MLRPVVFGVLFLGLAARISCYVLEASNELVQDIDQLKHNYADLKSIVDGLGQCQVDVHVHGDGEAQPDTPRTVNLNLHSVGGHHEEAAATDELFHRDDLYAVADMPSNGELGNHVHCKAHFAQHRTVHDSLDWRIACEGFDDHNKEHLVYMLPEGDFSENCHSLDHPDEHHGKLIAHVFTDEEGHVDQHYKNAEMSLTGEHNIYGKAFAIYDANNKDLAVACGLAGHAGFHEAFEVVKAHWHEDYKYTKDDLFGNAVFHSAHGSHVTGQAHIEQYRDHQFPLELELELEGFEHDDHGDYQLVLHHHTDISGNCENMGDYDPDHHGSDHIAHFTPDEEGKVHKQIDETDLSIKGDKNIIGHSLAIHAPDNTVIACGGILYSTYEAEAGSFHHDEHGLGHV